MGLVRVYIATSLDGFIAGLDDDLSWLPSDGGLGDGGKSVSYEAFMADVGAILMGRRTYDIVLGFGPWSFGHTPVLVPTHRPLDPAAPTVQAVQGDITDLVDQALDAAAGRDVYIDGATIIQAALRADVVDELIITIVPVLLGGGIPLFGELVERRQFEFDEPQRFGSNMVQLRAKRSAPATVS